MGTKSSVLPDARRMTPAEAMPYLMANRQFRKALENIRKLARHGHRLASGSEEEVNLLMFAYLAVRFRGHRGERRKEDWERRWARDTGKSWKALAEFPARLRRMAEDVKGLSGSPFFDPMRTATTVLPDTDWDFARQGLYMLPFCLEAYSNWLDERVKHVSAYMRYFYRRTPRGRLSAFTLHVSEQVKLLTGRLHDPEVAELLNAADLVLNPEIAKTGPRFDEQSIALLRYREKRKTPKT